MRRKSAKIKVLYADLEEIAEAETVMPIADRFFTPLERDAISLSPSPAEAFCRLWTLRESYVKMTGKGFDRGLAPLAMVFPGGTPKIKVDGKILDDVFFTEIRDVYKCRGAVCTKCKAEYSIEKILKKNNISKNKICKDFDKIDFKVSQLIKEYKKIKS